MRNVNTRKVHTMSRSSRSRSARSAITGRYVIAATQPGAPPCVRENSADSKTTGPITSSLDHRDDMAEDDIHSRRAATTGVNVGDQLRASNSAPTKAEAQATGREWPSTAESSTSS